MKNFKETERLTVPSVVYPFLESYFKCVFNTNWKYYQKQVMQVMKIHKLRLEPL